MATQNQFPAGPDTDRFEIVDAPIKAAAPAQAPAVQPKAQLSFPRPAPTRDDLARRAQELGVDPTLANSIFSQESSGNWGSKASPKGAQGGMQLMPGTFRQMMGPNADINDPWQNMEAGLRYLQYGQRRLKTNDPQLLAAGYHAGMDHPDLLAGRIPNTSDGLIKTSDYARNVAGRLGARPAASGQPEEEDALSGLARRNRQRFEVVEDAPAAEQPEDDTRYEVVEDLPAGAGLTQQEVDDQPVLGYLKDKAVGGYEDMTQALTTAHWAVAGGDEEALAEQLAKSMQKRAAKPKTTGEQNMDAAFKAVSDAKGVIDTTVAGVKAIGTALTEPKALAGEVVGSAANMLPSLGAGAAGAGGGAAIGGAVGAIPGAVTGAILGGRAGMAAGTTATELGAEIKDMIAKRLQDSGQPPTAQNVLAILKTPEFREEARNQGLKKGLTVAAVDQVFLGLGGKIATAPARREAAKSLADQGVDVSTRAARREALASPAGRAAVEAAKPSLGARAVAGAAAVGVDAVGETTGEGLSQFVARGEVDAGDALREGVTSLGQSVAEVGAGVLIERGKRLVDATRAPTVPAPAPSKASGPLTRATENAADTPQRVVATAPDGTQVEGTVTATAADGRVEIVADDGEVFTVKTGPGGVKIEPVKPDTPLTNAVEQAADATPALEIPEEATPAPKADTPDPFAEAPVKAPPPAPAPQVAVADMDDAALAERMDYLKQQAKGNGGWNATLMKARREIEREMTKRKAAAPAPVAVSQTPAAPPVVQSTPAQQEAAKLPRELAGAKPRYSYGPKQFDLQFDSDVDRAAYVIAQEKTSSRDADYLKFVMDATGLDEAGARAFGRRVRDAIKAKAKVAEPGTLKVPEVARGGVTVEKTPVPAAAPEFAQEGNVPSRQTLMKSEAAKRARELEANGKSAGDDPLVRALDAIYNPLQANDKDAQLYALNYGEENNRSDIAAEAKANLATLADKLEREAESDTTTPAVPQTSPKYQKIKTDLEARKAKKGADAAEIRARLAGKKAEPVSQPEAPAAEAPAAVGSDAAPAQPVPAAGGTAGVEPAGVAAPSKFDPKGLKPGTPEYEAAFEKWSFEQQDAKANQNRARQRQENKAAVDKRNGWRAKIREWFLGSKDGDTISDTGTGQTYKVIEKTRKDGTKTKTLVATDENGNPLSEGRAATGISQVGERVEGLDDGGIDEDTGSATPETAGQSLASSLGKMLEDGDAQTSSSSNGAPTKPKTASKEDLDRLFGVDEKRKKALDRIAAGKAWFNDGVKAKDFIAKNGLKDTHEVKQGKGGRWDVVAKATAEKESRGPDASRQWVNEGKSEADLVAEKAQELGRELAGTIYEESRQSDFKPSELPAVVQMWAGDNKVPADALRAGVLESLDRYDFSEGRKRQIRNALSPAPTKEQTDASDNRAQQQPAGREADQRAEAAEGAAPAAVQPDAAPAGEEVADAAAAVQSEIDELKARRDLPVNAAQRGDIDRDIAKLEADKAALQQPAASAPAPAQANREVTSETARRGEFKLKSGELAKVVEHSRRGMFSVSVGKADGSNMESMGSFQMDDQFGISRVAARAQWAMDNVQEAAIQFALQQRQADEQPAAPAPAPAPAAEKLAPFTRVNGPAERAAADRLEQLYAQMEKSDSRKLNSRSEPETGAKMTVRNVIDELRKPSTVVSVVPMLETAAQRLNKNFGAMADVIREVADTLDGKAAPAAATASDVSPLTQARNDLIEVNTRIEQQGQVVDARLMDRQRQLQALIKDLEGEQQATPTDETPTDPTPPTGGGKPDPFAGNKLFTSDKVEAARARMKAKLGRLNSGFDPEMAMDGMIVAGAYIEAGTRSFASYAKAMVEDFGDGVKPYLLSFYEAVRHYPGLDTDGMSTPSSALAQHEAMMLAAAEGKKAKPEPEATNEPAAQPEQSDDPTGNGADDAEPLDPELPAGNPELAQDVAPDAGAGLRGTDANGNGRADSGRVATRTGVGRGKKPVLSGSPAEVRPVSRTPVGPAPDAQNQLFGEAPGNYEITDQDAIGEGTAGQKLRANMDAIRTLRRIQKENRNATPEEQATMAKFVGWGGLRALIDPNTTGKQWLDARAELLGTNGQAPLLVDGEKGSEWIALQRSTTAAHYTAPEIVKSMWDVVRHFGFTGGRVLEPTSGIGNFIGLQPRDLAAASEWHGAELDIITGQLAKLIYPEASIAAGIGFQDVPFAKGAFDLAIGNPPFGSLTIKSSIPAYKDIPEMKLHNYIIAKTGEHLRPGGVMAMVVTHRFLDTANPEAREHLAKGFKFLGAFRLPNDAFLKNAGTEVTTDVIFLQKLHVGEKAADQSWLDTDGKITVDGQEIRVNRYYEQNPANILGRSAMDGTMYAGRAEKGGEYTVHSDGRDLKQAIADLVQNQWAGLKDVAKATNADTSAAAVMIKQSDLPVGGVMLDESGKLMRREMDDEAGNAVIVEITPQTIWKDGGDKWKALADAAAALKTAKDVPLAAEDLRAAAGVAYNAKGEKKPSPTKAEQAVYEIVDAAMAPGFRWQYDTQMAAITASLDRKKLGADGYQALKGMIGLRNTALRLIEAERADNTAAMDALRAQLNAEYDAFVAKHGFISDPANSNLLDGDVGVESGLEAGYKPRNGKIKSSARKADIFTRRVNFPYREITSAKDAADGLQISLSERGRLDIAYIAKLTGKSAMEVIGDLSGGESPLIFLDPDTNEYTDADAYLSGNVKAKLDKAKAAGMKANVRALEAVQPPPKTKDNVRPSIRGAWMPEKVFQDFLADLGVRSPKVSIIPSQGMIIGSGQGLQETEFGSQFKNSNKSIVEIFNAAASGKPINIFTEDAKGNRVKNETATKEVNLLVERMAKVFNEWAWSNDDRIQSVVDAFNEKMNTHVARKFDGRKYLKTVGASPSIELRTTQKNAAWRIVQAQTVLLDHVVGAGKTFTVITGAMQRRRLGLSRKPMIVVPNHLVTQWAKDFYALYPGAKILAATPDDFAKNKRRRLFSRIATGDFDAVIIGHSSLSFIETPAADQQMVINEQIKELQDVLNELKAKKESGRTLTQIQEKLQKYEGKLKELQDVRRDEIGIDLEKMGVDYLAIDEMHEFKNLEYSTAGERVVGMNDPKGSKKAFDLYLKIRGVLARGGAVTGATGTPVSNSLVELYTMMKYLAHKDLVERNQLNFDAWSGAYARTETKLEYTATQKLKPRRVLAGLNNLSALKQLYEQFGDVISMADLKRMHAEDVRVKNAKEGTKQAEEFPVPKVKGGSRVLESGPITSQQSAYMDYLVARMQAIEANKRNKEYARIDNPLYVLTDARKMSLDIRIVDPAAPRDENGKVMRAAANIVSTYKKWDKYRGTQMVFCDLSTPAKNAVKEARSLIRESIEKLFGTGADAKRIAARVKDIPTFTDQWRFIESMAAEVVESPNTDPEVADKMEAYLAGLEDVDATMTTADVGFSVYDDMKKVLVEQGIPEAEIAFIHDYNTPEQKAKLFAEVNDGTIRVLLGSSAKMGAGTNAQKRLVALHHMDAPWRPSDVEQREGRIIRQGNGLYGVIHDYGLEKGDLPADLLAKAADLKRENPNGFEVEIKAYSTAGTSDAVMWQVLERKARAIEEFRSAGLDATDEEGSDSNQYAEFMAQSTGNPVFRLKLEAEREVDVLDTDSRGAILAKQQAQRFLETYERDLRDARAAITYGEAAKFDEVKVGRESGTAAELAAVMDAARQKYEKAYADYLTKKEAADKELAEWNALTELERGDKPKMPTAPSMPGILSKPMQEGSGYARAIKAALEAGTNSGENGYEFAMGNMRLRVRKSRFSDDQWILDAWNGAGFETYAYGDGKTADASTKLANALTPDALRDLAAQFVAEGRRREQNLTSQYPIKSKLAAKTIDTGKLQEARKVMEWYRTQVAFAEQQADIRRGERPNRYIASDRKRDLTQAKAELGDTNPIEFDGEVFRPTGFRDGNILQATGKDGREVLLFTMLDKQGNRNVERVIEKPKGVEFSGLMQPSKPDEQFSVADQVPQRPASAYAAAPQAHADMVRAVADSLTDRSNRTVSMQAVGLPDGDAGKTMKSIAALAKRLFNREVVYVRFDGQPVFNGMVSGRFPGKVFLNVDSARPLMAVLGHELLHEMAKTAPGIYAALSQRLNRVIKDDNIYADLLRQKYDRQGLDFAGVDAREELEADILGDNFMDAEFWRLVAQDQPGLFQRIAEAIMKWLDAVARKVGAQRPFGTEKFLADIAEARAAVADAVRQFSAAEVGAVAERDGDQMSVADVGQTDTPAFRRWFGDSKVVDEQGRPLVVYHGTARDFTDFDPKRAGSKTDSGGWGSGIYFAADPEYAGIYAGRTDGANIVPVYVALQNPLVIDARERTAAIRGMGLEVPRGDPTPAWSQQFANAVAQRGYDGVLVTLDGAPAEIVAFRPEQIKSAIGNRGTFDPASDDIRYSIAENTPEGLTPPPQGLLRRIQAAVQDNLNRVRQVQERIEKLTGRKPPEYADYYGAETNRPGRVAARLEDARDKLIQPLMAKLAKSGHTAKQLGELMHAQHAAERNEAVAKINPDMPGGGSGMTNAEAAAILEKYRNDKALLALADEARAITKATLELKLAYGLIDIDTFTTLAERYEFYVPLKGDGEYGPKIKRAMGHLGREEFILENIARDHEQAIVVGERNQARQSLLQMVLTNPDPKLWTVGMPPRGRYVAGKVFTIKRNGEEVAVFDSQAQVAAFLEGKGSQAGQYEVVDDGGERVQSFVKPLQDNEVMVYVDGQPVRIQIVGDDVLARQLRPLDQGKMNVILEFMRGFNRYLSRIYTGYNPAFIFVNLSRDLMTGTVNILGNEGAGVAARAWANYPAALAAITQWASTKKLPGGEMGRFLAEYRANGGKTGASWMADLEEQGKNLQRMYDDAYGAGGYLADGKLGKAAWIAGRKTVGGMAHVIEIANQATENGLRLALFVALRKQGMSAGQAAQAAKNVTVNFDRKGTMTPALGAIYLFFNPAVQGTANAIKTVFKGANKEQAWAALGMLTALGFYTASQGMDDDEDRWLGTGWDQRSKNMLFNLGEYTVRVPVSLEFAPFYALGVAMAEASRGESKMATAGRVVSSFIGAYFPLSGVYSSDSNEPGTDLVQAAIPTIIKPGFQSAINRNSFGSPIVPESEFTKDRPDNLKMNRATKGSVYDQAAQSIAGAGEALGASRYENDITKVSPETLKHYWRTYTGGLGTFVTDLIGVAKIQAEGTADVEKGDTPIVKSFVQPNDVRAIRGRFFALADEVREAATEFREAKKAGDGQALDDFLNSPDKARMLSLDRLVRSTATAAARLRDEEVDINADTTLTLAEKRERIKDLQRREEEMYRQALEAFR